MAVLKPSSRINTRSRPLAKQHRTRSRGLSFNDGLSRIFGQSFGDRTRRKSIDHPPLWTQNILGGPGGLTPPLPAIEPECYLFLAESTRVGFDHFSDPGVGCCLVSSLPQKERRPQENLIQLLLEGSRLDAWSAPASRRQPQARRRKRPANATFDESELAVAQYSRLLPERASRASKRAKPTARVVLRAKPASRSGPDYQGLYHAETQRSHDLQKEVEEAKRETEGLQLLLTTARLIEANTALELALVRGSLVVYERQRDELAQKLVQLQSELSVVRTRERELEAELVRQVAFQRYTPLSPRDSFCILY